MQSFKAFRESRDRQCNEEQYFHDRTNAHIQCVQKYCERIANDIPTISAEELIQRGQIHDKSKFSENELIPYIYLTWQYKCERDRIPYTLPSHVTNEHIHNAVQNHYKVNTHHPEFYMRSGYIIGMPSIDVAEMVADWCAMSTELNNDPIEWAKANIDKNWHFNSMYKAQIFNLLQTIWY